jgi:NAD-dependent SIR2 family protein deacetylase
MTSLHEFIIENPSIVVITGAGLSVASGIPTYRDDDGQWQRSDPITHQQFVEDASYRRRYWARSAKGWGFVDRASPNQAHQALVKLERLGHIQLLVTQNVDRLHQRAGHNQVIDLHGRMDQVVCLQCGANSSRASLQHTLLTDNPVLEQLAGEVMPDGDADVDATLLEEVKEPRCEHCQGVLMPDVVFFGGTVPRARVNQTKQAIDAADGLLVVGSSLMVYSGFRFCRYAAENSKPLAILNRGVTRADELATLKVEADCCYALSDLAQKLENH